MNEVQYNYDSNRSPRIISINPTSGAGSNELTVQATLNNLNLGIILIFFI